MYARFHGVPRASSPKSVYPTKLISLTKRFKFSPYTLYLLLCGGIREDESTIERYLFHDLIKIARASTFSDATGNAFVTTNVA